MNLSQTFVHVIYATIFRKSGSANHATEVKGSNRAIQNLSTRVFALEKVLLYWINPFRSIFPFYPFWKQNTHAKQYITYIHCFSVINATFGKVFSHSTFNHQDTSTKDIFFPC